MDAILHATTVSDLNHLYSLSYIGRSVSVNLFQLCVHLYILHSAGMNISRWTSFTQQIKMDFLYANTRLFSILPPLFLGRVS